jgi:hypothetical protein
VHKKLPSNFHSLRAFSSTSCHRTKTQHSIFYISNPSKSRIIKWQFKWLCTSRLSFELSDKMEDVCTDTGTAGLKIISQPVRLTTTTEKLAAKISSNCGSHTLFQHMWSHKRPTLAKIPISKLPDFINKFLQWFAAGETFHDRYLLEIPLPPHFPKHNVG